MAELNFSFHKAQMDVFQDPARFKLVVAGRRFGKSWLAASLCLIHALQETNQYGYDVGSNDTYVFYIAPTFEQAKQAVWAKLKELGQDVIKNINQNQGIFELVNGRKIVLKGADRPDTLRGPKLSFVVLDEYASMRPDVWEEVISPALADVRGEALIIGTPDGKNHFYDLYKDAASIREEDDQLGVEDPEWGAHTYQSTDNPTIPIQDEMVAAARRGMSQEAIKQEYQASFHASGGHVFNKEDLHFVDEEPADGTWHVAVDPAGYADVEKAKGKKERLDQTAIAVVKVCESGWYVKEIRAGRWDVRRTAIEIIKAAHDVQAVAVGIEGGALKNALMPYLKEKQKSIGVFLNIVEVTHGGKKKTDRIAWALQGRLQQQKLMVNVEDRNAEWYRNFESQLLDFPNPLTHDDMLDALAYIDQVSVSPMGLEDLEQDEFMPLDSVSGY